MIASPLLSIMTPAYSTSKLILCLVGPLRTKRMVKGVDSRGNINPEGRDSSGLISINERFEVPSQRIVHDQKLSARRLKTQKESAFLHQF
jgi:hypothetical protein